MKHSSESWHSSLTWITTQQLLINTDSLLAVGIGSARVELGPGEVNKAQSKPMAMLRKLKASQVICTVASHKHTKAGADAVHKHILLKRLIKLLKTLMSHRHLSSPWIYLASAKAKEHSISKPVSLCLSLQKNRKNIQSPAVWAVTLSLATLAYRAITRNKCFPERGRSYPISRSPLGQRKGIWNDISILRLI